MLLFLAFIQSQPISFLLKATQVFTELESPPGEIWYKYNTEAEEEYVSVLFDILYMYKIGVNLSGLQKKTQ